jgi:hypothetical protein
MGIIRRLRIWPVSRSWQRPRSNFPENENGALSSWLEIKTLL